MRGLGLGLGLGIASSLLLLALAAELYYLLCWKKHRIRIRPPPLDLASSCAAAQASAQAPAPGAGDPLKCISISDDAELMRLQYCLPGPPRFLFTIKEEPDDASSDSCARSRARGRSLGDLLHCQQPDSPFHSTPLSSPGPLPLPLLNVGINPLFEAAAARTPSRSPPPKFQFLKEAEEKLQRRIALLEASRPSS